MLGKGHAGSNAFFWSIPLFWPMQIVRLPARGPRPVLRGEVPLTLRLLDDIDPLHVVPSCGATLTRPSSPGRR